MAKPSRESFNPKSNAAGVAWNCTRCGATGLAGNRATAGKQFDEHNCEG